MNAKRLAALAVIVACGALEYASRGVAVAYGLLLVPNSGVAFGFLRDAPDVVLCLSGAAAVIMAGLGLLAPAFGFWGCLGLSMMAGGAAANFVSRLSCGCAMDWIPLPFSDFFVSGGLHFNLADVEIGLGAILVLIGRWRQ